MSPDWIDTPLDLLVGYVPGMALPRLRHKTDRPWHPEDSVNKRTNEDTHWFWMKKNITAQRWRWALRKIKRSEINREWLTWGIKRIRTLIEKGAINMADIPDKDLERAEEALGYCAAVVKDDNEVTRNRLQAAKTLLDFSRAKPAQKSDVTIRSAESFLDELE